MGVEAGGFPTGIVPSWDGPGRLRLQGKQYSVSTKALFPLPFESPLFVYPQRLKLFAEHILQGFFHPWNEIHPSLLLGSPVLGKTVLLVLAAPPPQAAWIVFLKV